MKARSLLYFFIKMIHSDYLFRLFIKHLPWTSEYYYVINKDGSKTKSIINYFPVNPELSYDGHEAYHNKVVAVNKIFGMPELKEPQRPKFKKEYSIHEYNKLLREWDIEMDRYNKFSAIRKKSDSIVSEIAKNSGRIKVLADWAKGMDAKIKRIGNDRLVEVMEVNELKPWTQWKVSYVPLKYISINT